MAMVRRKYLCVGALLVRSSAAVMLRAISEPRLRSLCDLQALTLNGFHNARSHATRAYCRNVQTLNWPPNYIHSPRYYAKRRHTPPPPSSSDDNADHDDDDDLQFPIYDSDTDDIPIPIFTSSDDDDDPKHP